MTTTSTSGIRRAAPAAARLSSAAGWSAITIAALHIAVFVPQAPWSEWFDGALRTADADPESLSLFWALPGGIAVPGALMGLLMVRLGRQGQRVGLGYAAVLIAWPACCIWLIGPSGFIALLVPGGLLIAAAVVDRRSPETAAR
ncbi:hypothetical protein [Glycomyces tenuis]|uniref:hypothetical protein n=1 Tax=Glycomyces tenuis TaxID=58116 RepID=UPI00041EC1A2|nr:hypothetical protein [Glycomyces tenuis]